MTIDTDPTPAHGTKRPNFNPSIHRQHKMVLIVETKFTGPFHHLVDSVKDVIADHSDLITHTTTEITLSEHLNEQVIHIDTSLF